MLPGTTRERECATLGGRMQPARLLPLLVLLAAGAGAWLLLGTPDTADVESVGDGGAEATTPPTAVTLKATGKAPTKTAPAAKNPYDGVTDWKKLGRGLWLNAERDKAVPRCVELLRGSPEETRKLLRRMHPDAGASQSTGQNIQRGVAQVLVALGPQHLGLLLEELADENAIYRTRILAVIGTYRAQAARIMPQLLERFRAVEEDPPEGETASYVNAFAWIGPASKAIVPDLERWLDDGATEVVETAAIRALALIEGPTEAVFDRFKELLRADGWQAQRRAVITELTRFKEKAALMVPFLFELADEGVLSESSAVHTAATMGIATPEVLDRAEKSLRATPASYEGLGWAGVSLALLGEPGLKRLLAYVERRGPLARAKLIVTLAVAKFDAGRIYDLTKEALVADDVRVRRQAWIGLGMLEDLSPAKAEPSVLRGLEDEDDTVRRSAVGVAISRIGPTPAVLDVLMVRIEDEQENAENRIAAVAGLVGRYDKPPDGLFKAILALAEAHPEKNASYYLWRWLPTRTQVVLDLWVGAARKHDRPRIYARFIAKLPIATRRRHAETIRALRIDPETGAWMKKKPTRKSH